MGESLEVVLVGHAPVDVGVKEETASGSIRVSCQLRDGCTHGGRLVVSGVQEWWCGGGLDAAKPAVAYQSSRAPAPSRAPLFLRSLGVHSSNRSDFDNQLVTPPIPIMSGRVRSRVSYTSASTSYPEGSSTTPRPDTRLSSNGRPPTGRPRTAASTLGSRDQQVICAISESRGISPVVGLAFVNLTTTEAVLCQISDNQTFTRTIHKLVVYEPTELLFMTTAAQPKSKLLNIVEYNIPNLRITVIDRKYWSETTGLEYIQHLAFKQDVEAIKVSVGGNFYATCCIAAVCFFLCCFDPLSLD